MENNMAIPKKLNTELSYDTVISPSRDIPKKNMNGQNKCGIYIQVLKKE